MGMRTMQNEKAPTSFFIVSDVGGVVRCAGVRMQPNDVHMIVHV